MKIILGEGEYSLHQGHMGALPCIIFTKNKVRGQVGAMGINQNPEKRLEDTRQAVGAIGFTDAESVDALITQLKFVKAGFMGLQ